jgi:hypothetical protein
MDIVVRDDPKDFRFVGSAGDDVAGVAYYRLRKGQIAFTHTEVDPAFRGQGVGAALAREALGSARQRDLAVLPLCPYIRGFIAKHPDYVDLVPAGERARFGLDDAAG